MEATFLTLESKVLYVNISPSPKHSSLESIFFNLKISHSHALWLTVLYLNNLKKSTSLFVNGLIFVRFTSSSSKSPFGNWLVNFISSHIFGLYQNPYKSGFSLSLFLK